MNCAFNKMIKGKRKNVELLLYILTLSSLYNHRGSRHASPNVHKETRATKQRIGKNKEEYLEVLRYYVYGAPKTLGEIAHWSVIYQSIQFTMNLLGQLIILEINLH